MLEAISRQARQAAAVGHRWSNSRKRLARTRGASSSCRRCGTTALCQQRLGVPRKVDRQGQAPARCTTSAEQWQLPGRHPEAPGSRSHAAAPAWTAPPHLHHALPRAVARRSLTTQHSLRPLSPARSRLSTVHAVQIVVVPRGAIEEIGSHRELPGRGGLCSAASWRAASRRQRRCRVVQAARGGRGAGRGRGGAAMGIAAERAAAGAGAGPRAATLVGTLWQYTFVSLLLVLLAKARDSPAAACAEKLPRLPWQFRRVQAHTAEQSCKTRPRASLERDKQHRFMIRGHPN